VGAHSSDKYYLNQDRQEAAKAALKGGAKDMAEVIRQKNIRLH
jgi:hypothetical protein